MCVFVYMFFFNTHLPLVRQFSFVPCSVFISVTKRMSEDLVGVNPEKVFTHMGMTDLRRWDSDPPVGRV